MPDATKTWYVCHYRKAGRYIDEGSGLMRDEVEATSRPDAIAQVCDGFTSNVLYARTGGHRDLTEDEKAAVHTDEMDDSYWSHSGAVYYNDPKNEPRDL